MILTEKSVDFSGSCSYVFNTLIINVARQRNEHALPFNPSAHA
jgi:hypothetical protein